MKFINKLVKFFGLLGIHLLVIFQSYILSIICTGSILSVVNAIVSIFRKVNCFTEYPFWAVLLISSIPLCILFTISVETDVFKRNKTKSKAVKNN